MKPAQRFDRLAEPVGQVAPLNLVEEREGVGYIQISITSAEPSLSAEVVRIGGQHYVAVLDVPAQSWKNLYGPYKDESGAWADVERLALGWVLKSNRNRGMVGWRDDLLILAQGGQDFHLLVIKDGVISTQGFEDLLTAGAAIRQ